MRLVATVPLNTPPELRAVAEDVLGAASNARFVTVASLMAYAGPDGLTLELLDAWCRAGLLHRGRVQPDPIRPEEVEYVALTMHGARALHAATGKRVPGITNARLARSSRKRMHDVLVGEVALSLHALAKHGDIDLVGVETDDRKLASVVHVVERGRDPDRIVLQPDALVVTKGAAGTEALLVEVDRSTCAPMVMGRRFKGYLAWQRELGPAKDFGIRALRVVTLVPTEARLEKLHAAALLANGGRRSGFLTFALLDDLTVCTAERWLDPIARPLGGDPGHHVRLLSFGRATRAA
jgi:hypothetical protein